MEPWLMLLLDPLECPSAQDSDSDGRMRELFPGKPEILF